MGKPPGITGSSEHAQSVWFAASEKKGRKFEASVCRTGGRIHFVSTVLNLEKNITVPENIHFFHFLESVNLTRFIFNIVASHFLPFL